MEEFTVGENTFRIKKMNAIEILALRGQITFDNFEATQNAYLELLSRVEVKIKDQWLAVRQGNEFYPKGIDEDVKAIETIILKVMSYLKEVFQKSNTSKKETE